MILSKIIAKPFIIDTEDINSISIPQKYIGQIIKTPTQSYKITSIDSDGNATFVKIIDKIDLDNVNNNLNNKITNEINRAVGVEGNLSNIDSSLNNTNLVGAINSSYSKIKKIAVLNTVNVDDDYSANVGELILVDTSDKEITIDLPSANDFDKIEIKDITGNAHTNNIIVSSVGGEDLHIDVNSYKIKLIYKDEWIIL